MVATVEQRDRHRRSRARGGIPSATSTSRRPSRPADRCAFDPGDPGSVRFAPNSSDAYVAKYGSAEQISPPYNPLGCDGTVKIDEAISPGTDLVIAPNPVDRYFTLTGTTPFDPRARVVVRDALGREMNAPFTIQQGRIEVDATALTPGAYVITLHSSAGALTSRFAKH
jgi:hypothetical protein